MLFFAVCDDESVSARSIASRLRSELSIQNLEYKLEIFTNSKALAEKLVQGVHFDVLLADIDMPELDGIRLGTLYRAELQDTLLIYISNREDLVFEAFQAKPFRFIRKKHMEKLPAAIRDVFEELKEKEKRKIAFPCGLNNTVLLRPERICYVEAMKKKQMIHCDAQVYEISSSFLKVMELLSDYGFVQSHKSFFVNSRFIHSIGKTELKLDNGTIIPVSRSYYKQVQDAFVRYAINLRSAT